MGSEMCIRDRRVAGEPADHLGALQSHEREAGHERDDREHAVHVDGCLLYTSDAADERSSVDLGGRRIIKKNNKKKKKELKR